LLAASSLEVKVCVCMIEAGRQPASSVMQFHQHVHEHAWNSRSSSSSPRGTSGGTVSCVMRSNNMMCAWSVRFSSYCMSASTACLCLWPFALAGVPPNQISAVAVGFALLLSRFLVNQKATQIAVQLMCCRGWIANPRWPITRGGWLLHGSARTAVVAHVWVGGVSTDTLSAVAECRQGARSAYSDVTARSGEVCVDRELLIEKDKCVWWWWRRGRVAWHSLPVSSRLNIHWRLS
jgi:hypothetical protein